MIVIAAVNCNGSDGNDDVDTNDDDDDDNDDNAIHLIIYSTLPIKIVISAVVEQ